MKKMGLYLREKRESKGLTQAQVAMQLGYGSPQFISNIERGVSRVPLKSLKNFISLYNLQASEVIEVILDEKRDQLKTQLESSDSESKEQVQIAN